MVNNGNKKRALISVFYKDDIEKVAQKLIKSGWEIISTGGTARYLKEHQVSVIDAADLTGFPEILGGRVKTLHPLIFGPILAKKSKEHLDQLKEFSTQKIDMVIVNFYPFEEALGGKEKGIDFMIENIDIGGPSMVRAASKNFKDTIVIVNKDDYLPIIDIIEKEGDIGFDKRKELAGKAFAYTSFYDSLIAGYMQEEEDTQTPGYKTIAGRKSLDLRYGENPHQKAALYIYDKDSPLSRMEKIQGKELSYNNILDLSMVYEVLGSFKDDNDFTVIVKHQNPCGAAIGKTQKESFQKAFEGDSKSAFGGIVGFNKCLDAETAAEMRKIFFEVIIAPDFTQEALDTFKKKKNLRLIKVPLGYKEVSDIKTIPGGFVFQERDNYLKDFNEFEQKTPGQIYESQTRDIQFGWKLIKFVKSNGIIIVKDEKLIGVGAGQMSRVDAVELSIKKSQSSIEGSVLVSDAFFPFPDSIEFAAQNQISVVVEPGGSVRDDEVIEAAKKHNISLIFTHCRHFRH
jgi:phosphoribosylaminoimidazolecarboxamide formyltransferase/IMP cyclohydrolase